MSFKSIMTQTAEKSILVVDDEPGFHDMLRYLLEPLGFIIHSAHDGLEGLERVRGRNYDIIFLDVHMPKMNGAELLKIIRELKPLQFVVVMSSGSDPRQVFEKTVKELGAMACLFKPFEINQVIDAVNTFTQGIAAK